MGTNLYAAKLLECLIFRKTKNVKKSKSQEKGW